MLDDADGVFALRHGKAGRSGKEERERERGGRESREMS